MSLRSVSVQDIVPLRSLVLVQSSIGRYRVVEAPEDSLQLRTVSPINDILP